MKRPFDDLHNFGSAIEEISAQIRQTAENFRDVFAHVQETMGRVTKALQELPQKYHHIQPYLADRGWFLGGGLTPGRYARLVEALDKSEHDVIESFMRDFAKSRIDDMLEGVREHCPKRSAIVGDAVEAHREAKYTLSIPALLAQSDGICHDILAAYLFTKRKGTTASAIRRLLEPTTVLGEPVPLGFLNDLFLKPLRGSSSISERTEKRDERRKRDPTYGPLNRHGVLHGIDLDYPTEANSLRTILLIDYLIEVKQFLDSHQEWVNRLREDIEQVAIETNDTGPG